MISTRPVNSGVAMLRSTSWASMAYPLGALRPTQDELTAFECSMWQWTMPGRAISGRSLRSKEGGGRLSIRPACACTPSAWGPEQKVSRRWLPSAGRPSQRCALFYRPGPRVPTLGSGAAIPGRI
eukprot:5525559-Pyramimonas_sp.AAC.1